MAVKKAISKGTTKKVEQPKSGATKKWRNIRYDNRICNSKTIKSCSYRAFKNTTDKQISKKLKKFKKVLAI